MRMLCTSTSGAGHFAPLIPFIQAYRQRGHDVLVAGPPALASAAVATGAPFWAFDDSPADEFRAVQALLPTLSRDEANATVCREIFGRLNTTAAIPRLREAIQEWRPDVVLRESAEFGGAVAAELHGVPHACVAIGVGATEETLVRLPAAEIDKLRGQHGLPGDPAAERLRSVPQLSLFPAGLDAAPQPSVLRFRDPAWRARRRRSAPAGERPLVYLTFGTVAGKLPWVASAYGAACAAVEGLDADVLLTLGRHTDPAIVGDAPPNVQVEAWVDQVDVLARADAVVCHGGGASTLGVLAAGVPQVVVPLFAFDQFINADRVAAVGAGVAAEPTPESIRAALDAVLSEQRYRAGAAAVAAEIDGHRSVDEAPEVLAGALVG